LAFVDMVYLASNFFFLVTQVKLFWFDLLTQDKALKGLVAHETPYTSGLNAASEIAGNHSGNFCSECNIAGLKAPLDFTLKTRMRVASSCSVNRWVCQVYLS
jgi:hypothetical protein